ncbi:MAG: dipeptidase [Candidatus Eremiobacteraeota bacterium]|nr:dipeptidase [Candidatus Eremiobacteraeota bacterium]
MIGNDEELLSHVRRSHERYLDELKALIAIPSVSANPQHRDDMQRCAMLLVERMRGIGFEAELLATDGAPFAYGRYGHDPTKPTVLIYGHYDVQPPEPFELWLSPPFEGTVRDGNIYGRGAVDDKGQVLMHLAALEAHLHVRGELPINVIVLVEGEEEIGSPNFESALVRYRDRFQADLAVISDTAVYSADTPALTTSVRGLVHWDVRVTGPSEDLHSGYFGGLVRNPIEALAMLIASLKDDRSRVSVPGFYDGAPELDEAVEAQVRGLAYDEHASAAELGVPQLWGERGVHPLARMWYRPTLECNGIWGGYQGPGHKTVIPSFACAKLSARLVGAQDPLAVRDAVKKYLLARVPTGVRVHVEDEGTARAVLIGHDHPAVAAAATAMERGFGKAPIFIGTGGSITPVGSFDRIFGLPQVMIGVGLPDDRIHAPNEKFSLKQFFGGIETMAMLYDELAESLPARERSAR